MLKHTILNILVCLLVIVPINYFFDFDSLMLKALTLLISAVIVSFLYQLFHGPSEDDESGGHFCAGSNAYGAESGPDPIDFGIAQRVSLFVSAIAVAVAFIFI